MVSIRSAHELINKTEQCKDVDTYKCIYTLTTSSLYPLSIGVICRAKLYINNEEYTCVDLIVQDKKILSEKKTELKTLYVLTSSNKEYFKTRWTGFNKYAPSGRR